ncbi:MAG: D-Ala-D-Ala carboxypeptidase family metallohydrolase, partial [Pseudomonadota bacterium]
AKSVVDVILGEAKAGSYEDMLAIASVIENRSRKLGVRPEQVVSVRSEFNAFGKALPAGVDKHRDLAQKALEQVEKTGPVHDATFYATPRASNRLPSGLNEVVSTDGHVFFTDPQNRSIRTSKGFKSPQGSLLSFAPAGPLPPQSAPRNGQEAIASAMSGSALRQRANRAVATSTEPLGILPSLDASFDYPLQDRGSRTARGFKYGPENFDINRMHQPTARAARRAFDNLGINPGINSSFRSGEVPKGAIRSYNSAVGGAAASQHKLGRALDIDVRGMSGQQRAELVDSLMSEGLGGIGEGPNFLHADSGTPRSWTYGNSMSPEVADVIAARREGGRLNRYPTEFGTIPAPAAKPSRVLPSSPISEVARTNATPMTVTSPAVEAARRALATEGSLSPSLPVGSALPDPARVVDTSQRSLATGGNYSENAQYVGPQDAQISPVASVYPTKPDMPTIFANDLALPSLSRNPFDSYKSSPQAQPYSVQNPSVVSGTQTAAEPPSTTPISAPPSGQPLQSSLPDIDAPSIDGVGVPRSKPATRNKRNNASKQLGQIAGAVLGGAIAGPFGAIPGAIVGRQLGKAGLPQMGPLSIGGGFGRTATGQAISAATRGGGFNNAEFTRSYANAGGSDDPHSYSIALANEQRERSLAGQNTVGDAFGGWF